MMMVVVVVVMVVVIMLMTMVTTRLPECRCNWNLCAENLQKLVIQTIIAWAKSDLVANQNLIRAMFSLFHRQYDGVSEVML